jgi:hypothetical protein
MVGSLHLPDYFAPERYVFLKDRGRKAPFRYVANCLGVLLELVQPQLLPLECACC